MSTFDQPMYAALKLLNCPEEAAVKACTHEEQVSMKAIERIESRLIAVVSELQALRSDIASHGKETANTNGLVKGLMFVHAVLLAAMVGGFTMLSRMIG